LCADDYPLMIDRVRDYITTRGWRFYVIENVSGARFFLLWPVMLCGSMFGLNIWRHRFFESWPPMAELLPPCKHDGKPIDVTGTGGPSKKPRTAPGGGLSRKPGSIKEAREVMGIDWMTRAELSQAIPPAYTEWIGRQLMEQL
jgi:DNA (cytosine-5)-methyltransferase 1